MPSRRHALVLAALGLGVATVLLWLTRPPAPDSQISNLKSPSASDLLSSDLQVSAFNFQPSSSDSAAGLAAQLRAALTRPGVRADEGLLVFKDAAAYRRFLARASSAGLTVVARLDGLLAARVRVSGYAAFVSELGSHAADYAGISANPVLSASPPPAEDRAARSSTPVGQNLLATLGLAAPDPAAGRGVLVAILDGGASPDSTLGNRLRYQDIGYGVAGPGDDGAHATAVASLVAGASPDARGVAPAAELLSIRVTGPDGLSDTFSVAQGILAALDSGARVINISLGGYATSPVLTEAVERALAAGVAIVASSGNDQAARLVYPAAYAGVVSVGATDATGTQALFSNSGPTLQLTAPGYAIQAAGPAGTRVEFSGTSASAPVVSGALAALLSANSSLAPLAAADLLATHANDGGPAGPDPDYGQGTLNLAWALDHANPARIDPAVSSQSYDPATGLVSIVVQNRSSRPLDTLALAVSVSDTTTTQPVGTLAPGASTTIQVPVDRDRLAADGRLIVRSQLVLPAEVSDQVPANNRRAGLISAPAR